VVEYSRGCCGHHTHTKSTRVRNVYLIRVAKSRKERAERELRDDLVLDGSLTQSETRLAADLLRASILDPLLDQDQGRFQGHSFDIFATSFDLSSAPGTAVAKIMYESMGWAKSQWAMLRPPASYPFNNFGQGFPPRCVIPLALSDSQLLTGSGGVEGSLQQENMYREFGIRLWSEVMAGPNPPLRPGLAYFVGKIVSQETLVLRSCLRKAPR
jgi:hypothetical protein